MYVLYPPEDTTVISDNDRLLLKVFHDYYVRNLSQNAIAERHRISRKKVQRLLDRGREENLVEVKIRFPSRMHGELESALEDRFNLLEAIVCDAEEDESVNRAMMIRNASDMAADYLLRVLATNMTVSITWSDHVARMLEEAALKIASLREKPRNIRFVLTLGAMLGSDPDIQTLDAARRLSGTVNGSLSVMMAPGLAATRNARQAFLSDPQIAETVDLAKHADVAFFGIGSMDGDSRQIPILRKLIPDMIDTLSDLGAVGDINGYFFNAAGVQVRSELDTRMMGLTIADIKKMPLSVGIATGRRKFGAIRAILAGGVLKVLVTDAENARRLLES